MMLFDRQRDEIACMDMRKCDNGNYKNVTHLFHLFSICLLIFLQYFSCWKGSMIYSEAYITLTSHEFY